MTKQPPAKLENLKLTKQEPSLLFAIQELLKTGGIDWDEWWDEWKHGIPNRNQKVTNYRIDEWEKPKFIELIPKKNKSGVRAIEYFPDRDDETTSYIFCGRDRDLIFHIIALGYQKGNDSTSIPGKNSKPVLKGFPAIQLLFVGKNNVVGTKLIRCVRFTDDVKLAQTGLAEIIKSADIAKWAKNIKSIFGSSNYCWKKGKECLSYSGQIARLQGLEGYAYVRNKQDGIELFTKMLAIFDLKPDVNGFNYSGSTNTAKYSKVAKKQKVLNKEIKLDSDRPVADCFFYSATLRLPLLKKPIPLVKREVILYKE